MPYHKKDCTKQNERYDNMMRGQMRLGGTEPMVNSKKQHPRRRKAKRMPNIK